MRVVTVFRRERVSAKLAVSEREVVMMPSGLFITFEGIDGSGKTSQLHRLAVALDQLALPYVATREPGGSAAGERIRQVLIESHELVLEPKTELYLFLANRVQNLVEVVAPVRAAGQIVLSDRHRDSSVAFQGAGRELGVEWVERLHDEALDFLPDCTVLIDIPVEISRERARARDAHIPSGRLNRFEREGIAFHQRVADAYLNLAMRQPERFVVINGNQPINDVTGELFAKLASRYPDRLAGLATVRFP